MSKTLAPDNNQLRNLALACIQTKAREIDSIAAAISEVDSAWMASAERDRDEAAQLQQAVQRLAALLEGSAVPNC